MTTLTPKTTTTYIHSFGANLPIPPLDKNLLGGKGKGLAEMASLGLPIPPGFIITTEACNAYRHQKRQFPAGLEETIRVSMKQLESQMGLQFGSETSPLLISVRSGARVSMPGMMDTLLDLGLNDHSVAALATSMNNEHLAYDSYRRCIMMYSEIVEGIPRKQFEHTLEVLKKREGVELDLELSVQGLKQLCLLYKQIHEQYTSRPFPQDAYEQLFQAIRAVFNSWDSERAVLYRQVNHLPEEWGTAVIVQAMVFGNRNNNSATGVGFSRDPATGQDMFYGEFLPNAQGEEVVAGTRTPHPINKYQKELMRSQLTSLEELMPDVYKQLHDIVRRLELHYKDMQDIEFTIDDGKLYMLQTRTGKRTGFAAVRMAAEMLDKGLIDEKTAVLRVQPEQLIQLLAPVFDHKAKLASNDRLAGRGLNAGPGAASGQIALSSKKAVELQRQGIPCILVREETNPDDFPGIVAAEGILTLRGGSTSHAAVVARGMGKPCIVGCGALHIDESTQTVIAFHHPQKLTLHEGDHIAIDGSTGEVFFCKLETSPSEIQQVLLSKTKPLEKSLLCRQYLKIMELADKYRTLRVRANADTPTDSLVARTFGAEGIGLCRTEHMFFEVARLNDVRCMFFSIEPEERRKAIQNLLPHQKQDFIAIFRAMDGLPVTIRLLDPPLHEFMPHTENELKALANLMRVPHQQLAHIAASLEEHNPMLGHRGCRLGITYPELTEMQTRAIMEAAIEVSREGILVIPEIMVPLVGIKAELDHQKALIDKTIQQVFQEQKITIPYSVGTMIELPRSALLADLIAQDAEFFSFGTNDLTQTTFGISRDDSAKFVPLYVQGFPNPAKPDEIIHLLKDDPFQVIDRDGVGKLMQMAVTLGRQTRPKLKCGICGEHGGEPNSVAFCHDIGLDYVSCSPYRVPVARLAAAHAALVK
ncbi:MAG: pyruvate, phosphate dikinase [Parachlamydiaceae bacterium]|nr:pyruvate, phosphate dikinase [Parachlamydiaceae bacterium]